MQVGVLSYPIIVVPTANIGMARAQAKLDWVCKFWVLFYPILVVPAANIG